MTDLHLLIWQRPHAAAARALIWFAAAALVVAIIALSVIKTNIVVPCPAFVVPAAVLVDVHSPRDAIIQETLTNVGAVVERGQVVARLRSDDALDEIPHLEAQLRAASVRHEVAIELRSKSAFAANNTQRLRSAQLALERDHLLRVAKLRAEGLMTLDAMEDQRSRALDFELLRGGASSDAQIMGLRYTYELASLDQEMESLRARVAQLRRQVELSNVRSPVAGVVQRVQSWNTGQLVRGNDSLLSVLPDSAAKVELIVPNAGVGLVNVGQELRLLLSSYPREQFRPGLATVERIWHRTRTDADNHESVELVATAVVSRLPRGRTGDATVRPGMSGVGELLLGEYPVLTAWLRLGLNRLDAIAVRR